MAFAKPETPLIEQEDLWERQVGLGKYTKIEKQMSPFFNIAALTKTNKRPYFENIDIQIQIQIQI